jgi:hypothetical protein
MNTQRFENPASARYLPFAVFMAFIGFDEGARFLAEKGFITLTETTLYYLYPVKALVVAYLLYRFRHEYRELSLGRWPTFR